MFTPDERSTTYVFIGKDGVIPVGLEDHFNGINEIKLSDRVSERLRIHFDTAKNLALYSWFVYRFGPVAEHQAFISFEYALRERLKAKLQDPKNPPRFNGLLRMAVENGLLKNEGFTQWYNRKEQIKYINDQHKEMLESVGMEFQPLPEEVDYLSSLIETFPKLRNFYSHGTSMLHPVKLDVLLTCAEGINQLFEKPEVNTEGNNL
jgi:hypothetical protein